MIWIAVFLVACTLLLLLLRAQHRYERESAVAAMKEVALLQETVESLTRRVEILETIVTEDNEMISEDPEAISLEEKETVSSSRSLRSFTK